MLILYRLFLSKSIPTEPGLLELLQKVAGVRFFLDTVYIIYKVVPRNYRYAIQIDNLVFVY